MTTAMPNVDLRPDHWAIVRNALRRHVPDREVLVFGSRATWKAKDYSDLDLAIMGEEPLPLQVASVLDEALGESALPFKVDVVDWARIDDGFRRIIRRDGVIVQVPVGNAPAPAPPQGSPPQPRNSGAPGKWMSINIGQACTKIGSGATPRGGKDVYLPIGPYALIRSQNVLNDGFIHDGLAYIGEEHAIELAGVEVLDKDVLLNITGDSVARVCQVDPNILPARVNQHVAIVRPDPKKLDPRFLRYYLVCPEMQAKLLSWAGSGGTRNALTKAMIEALDLRAPENVSEQRAIAQVLGALDDKIESNRRMNERLEAMVRALFKSWFVDYDPVRAKIEGRDTGLPEDLAALFPNRLVDSEIGEKPEGWEVRTLAECIDVNPRRPLERGQAAPYLPMAKMPTQGHMPDFIAVRPFGSGMRFANGDTLVARITPCLENGKTAYVDFLADGEVGWGSTEYIVLRPQPSLPNQFAYCLARSSRFREFAIKNMSGTSGRQRVPSAALRGFLIIVPPARLGRWFGELAGPLFERARNAGNESRTLAALRETLLPKLILGEIRVGRSATKRQGRNLG